LVSETSDHLARAAAARRERRFADAAALLQQVLRDQPGHGPALNALGLTLLDAGDVAGALDALRRAAAADPAAPPVWLNLAEACRRAGRAEEEIASLDGALAINPYLLPALLKKALAYERMGDLARSAQTYRGLLAASPDSPDLPEAVRQALAHGRDVVRRADEQREAAFQGDLQAVMERYGEEDFARVRAYAEHVAGRRKIYQQQPTAGHFPFLPAIEFFDPGLFPWFARLEAGSAAVRDEFLALAPQAAGFRPYVANDPAQPVNQWAELNHSERWSAWFFWENGVRQDANCARCPRTAALVDSLPLLDIPGKAPSVMFSILAPHTRIPPHTGSSNVRVTIHLPLVIPPGCGFRVGAETREWRLGEAWAFDDTIEHEAWNDSDQPRAILILDAWNPLLTEAERAAVRVIT
jgi:aspartyl/asparaginyl beta-hydroxylase (cupin superfamily)